MDRRAAAWDGQDETVAEERGADCYEVVGGGAGHGDGPVFAETC